MEHSGTIKTGRGIIEAGKPLSAGGETVFAIFDARGWYLVCTRSRGGKNNSPLWVYGGDVVASE